MLESPYSNMAEQIAVTRRCWKISYFDIIWYDTKYALSGFYAFFCWFSEYSTFGEDYMSSSLDGTSDWFLSTWSSLTNWMWNFGEMSRQPKNELPIECSCLKAKTALSNNYSSLPLLIYFNLKVFTLAAQSRMPCLNHARSRWREGEQPFWTSLCQSP